MRPRESVSLGRFSRDRALPLQPQGRISGHRYGQICIYVSILLYIYTQRERTTAVYICMGVRVMIFHKQLDRYIHSFARDRALPFATTGPPPQLAASAPAHPVGRAEFQAVRRLAIGRHRTGGGAAIYIYIYIYDIYIYRYTYIHIYLNIFG